MATRPVITNDLFIEALHELHSRAPPELLSSLRAQLEQIRLTNPNSAQTARACLEGLASDESSLLHVLTAAYLINGGVMIKHQAAADEEERSESLEASESLQSEADPDPMQATKKITRKDTQTENSLKARDPLEASLTKRPDFGSDFESLEEKLNRFSISINGELKSNHTHQTP
jgi:hypothetical protein